MDTVSQEDSEVEDSNEDTSAEDELNNNETETQAEESNSQLENNTEVVVQGESIVEDVTVGANAE